jgi:Tol biopolymer transport system component
MRLATVTVLFVVSAVSAASAQAPPREGVVAFASNRASNIWAADLMVSQPGRKTVNVTRSLGIADRDADLSPNGNQLVFSRRNGAEEDLYTVTLGPRRLARLTFSPRQYESGPVYSPSGDAVAFVRGTLHNDDAVWIVGRAGGERRLTAEGGFISGLAWSPDGTRLTFSESNTGVFVIRRDGSGLRHVRGPYRSDLAPIDWLSAGIATLQSAGNAWRLQAVDPEDGSIRRLRNPCTPAAPVFSSDRTHVLCHSGLRGTHVQIRTRAGRPIRKIRIQLRSEHDQVQRFALGPRGRVLVFDSTAETRHADVWLLGRRLERLTGNHFHDHSPALSPDRRRVAFVRSPFESGRTDDSLMVVDARTRRVRPLCRLRGTSPSWSSDGRSVAFARAGDIHVVELARCRVRRLTRDRSIDSDSAWSRRGRAIAFVRGNGARATIRVISARGGSSTEVYSGSAADLSWAPDDGSLAFAGADGIQVLDLASRQVRTLFRDEDNRPGSPTWSPEGRTIAFSSGWETLPSRERAHMLRISTVDVATGAIAPLIGGWGLYFAPDWR